MAIDLNHSSKALIKLSEFLLDNHDLINVCMVDFITKDIFGDVVSRQDVADELSGMTDDQIIQMPERCSRIKEVKFEIRHLTYC